MLRITLTKFWKYLSPTWFNYLPPLPGKLSWKKGQEPSLLCRRETCLFFAPTSRAQRKKGKLTGIQIIAPHYLHSGQFLFFPLHAATAAKRKGQRPLSLPGGLPGYTKSRGHHTLPGFHSKKRLSFPGMSLIPSTTILILLPTSARTGIIRIHLSRAPLHRSLRA